MIEKEAGSVPEPTWKEKFCIAGKSSDPQLIGRKSIILK